MTVKPRLHASPVLRIVMVNFYCYRMGLVFRVVVQDGSKIPWSASSARRRVRLVKRLPQTALHVQVQILYTTVHVYPAVQLEPMPLWTVYVRLVMLIVLNVTQHRIRVQHVR